jgi:hypothetical protein
VISEKPGVSRPGASFLIRKLRIEEKLQIKISMQKLKTIILALLAVCITLGILWYGHRPVILKKATHDDVLDEARRGGYRLISTEKLWTLFSRDADKLLMVDTRQEWEFRTGHIKEAVNFPMEPTWWDIWRKKWAMQKLLGTDMDRHVIFY